MNRIYRTPTSEAFASQGRNRWVRADSPEQAAQLCWEFFRERPVEVFEVPEVRIWEARTGA